MAISSSHQRMFLVLYVGYLVIVYVRQSVSYAAPVIAESEQLADSDLGLIVSSQQMGYTFVKFVGGTLADVLDPGLTFMSCLCLTGFFCVSFTAMSSVSWFVVCWFLSGMAQGPAWSACAVLLKQHFPADQFATWWSILSTSSNVAGTAGPFVSQAIVSRYSWRASLLAAGSSALGLGFLCLFFFTSKSFTKDRNPATKEGQKLNMRALLTQPLVLVCCIYLLVSITRGACNDWAQMYLWKNKQQSLLAGSRFISSQELGGIVGSVLTGYLSDYLVSQGEKPTRSRLKIIVGLTVLQTVGLYWLIFHTSQDSWQILSNISGFLIGFGMYGCISLLGVVSMEVAPQNLSGTAHSLATLGGNIGRVIAGYPLSVLATWWSWHHSFLAVLLVSLATIASSVVCLKTLPAERSSRKLSNTD